MRTGRHKKYGRKIPAKAKDLRKRGYKDKKENIKNETRV